jgi:hypothetical protein
MDIENIDVLELHFDSKIDSNHCLKERVLAAYEINKTFFEYTLASKCVIRIIYKREEMDKVCGGSKTEPWLVGTTTSKGEIYIFSPTVFETVTSHQASNFDPILTHEIAHIFTNEIIKTHRPAWLTEGLAGYVAEQCKNKKLQNIDDFELLHSRDDWNKTPNYTQACQFTAYLVNRFGKIKLLQFLKNIPNNNGTRVSITEFSVFFTSFFNIDFKESVNEWQKKCYPEKNSE